MSRDPNSSRATEDEFASPVHHGEQELDELELSLQQQLETLQSKLSDLNEIENRSGAMREELRGHAKQLKSQRDEVEQREEDLVQRLQTLEQFEAELRARAQDLERREAQLTEELSQPAEADPRLRLLEKQCETLQREVTRLESALRTAQSRADVASNIDFSATPFNRVRHRRLVRMRQLLEERAAKIMQARRLLHRKMSEIETQQAELERLTREQTSSQPSTMSNRGAELRAGIEQRAAEMQQISEERAKLVQEREAMQAYAVRLNSRATKNSASLVLASVVFCMVAIAGLSWFVAGEVAKPTYLAQMTIGMEQSASVPSPKEVQSWTDYHVKLVSDPQLVEKVASSLRQRGYKDLSNPAELGAYLNDSLNHEVIDGGRVKLTLEGLGAERTQAVLQIYSGMLLSLANAARDRRLDKTPTVIVAPARSGDAPLIDPQPQTAGVIAGGLSGVALIVGFAALRVLGSGKGDEDDKSHLLEQETEWKITA